MKRSKMATIHHIIPLHIGTGVAASKAIVEIENYADDPSETDES